MSRSYPDTIDTEMDSIFNTVRAIAKTLGKLSSRDNHGRVWEYRGETLGFTCSALRTPHQEHPWPDKNVSTLHMGLTESVTIYRLNDNHAVYYESREGPDTDSVRRPVQVLDARDEAINAEVEKTYKLVESELMEWGEHPF